MSFWSGETLLARVESERLVEPFDKSRIDCAAYTLTLGKSAYTSGDSDQRKRAFEEGQTPGDLRISKGEKVTIQSGQFAFLLTEEKVTVPLDAIGFISIKATHKYAGLINVSGFHVDPGWSSPLIFAVFNAGPRELVFERGQPLFLIFFAALDQTSGFVKKDGKYFNHIPSDFIQKMAGEVPSLYKVNKTTRDLESQLKDVQGSVKFAQRIAGIALTISLAAGGYLFSKLELPSKPPAAAVVKTADAPVIRGAVVAPSVPAMPPSSKVKPALINPKQSRPNEEKPSTARNQ